VQATDNPKQKQTFLTNKSTGSGITVPLCCSDHLEQLMEGSAPESDSSQARAARTAGCAASGSSLSAAETISSGEIGPE
jgi:hypothetical protein